MKINYIQQKKIDYSSVQKYLTLSFMHNQFTNNGPVKSLLEKRIEQLINCTPDKRVLCVANGTNALHALMFYYEKTLNRRLKWVSPSFTFPSCVVDQSNTRLVDISLDTFTLREFDVGDADGIIITNLFGTIVDFDISKFNNKIIIYDNASSFLSKDLDGKNICLKGDASFGSLHHTKTLGFGEGGFMVVDSDKYDALQAICGFGFSYNRVHDVNSSNFKMSDPSAAFILQHIDNYNIARHIEVQDKLVGCISTIPNVLLFNYTPGVFYGNLPVLFNRPTQISAFRDVGIEANKYYKPLANHDNSNFLYDWIINFPLHMDLSDYDISNICDAIKAFS